MTTTNVWPAPIWRAQRVWCGNLLLSQSPDVFPIAVQQNWDAVLSGHTHRRQITLEHLNSRLNPARIYIPCTPGKYTQSNSSLFITSGLGTVGVPARSGANPEVVSIGLVNRASWKALTHLFSGLSR